MSVNDSSAYNNVNTDLIALAMRMLTIGNCNIIDVLMDCNIYLNKLNRSDLFQSANLIDLNLIFDCLNTTNEKQIKISCLMLEKLLSVLQPRQVFNKYAVSIESSLHHPNNVVKSTVLAELEKILIIDNNIDLQPDLICTIVDCLSNSDLSVSYKAVKCLKQFQSIETLSSLPILSKFQLMMEKDSQIRTRIYDILFHWSKSIDTLALISSKGLFSSLITDITNPDIMMQMVTVKMLIPLAITDHGFDYLNSVGIISGLYCLLNSSPKELSDPLVAILNPIILDFFINITLVRPQLVYEWYPKVFVVIYEILKENDDSLVHVAINAVNMLATSWDCKITLDIPAPNIMTNQYQDNGESDIWSLFIVELYHIASDYNNKFKSSAIKAIMKIIQIENDEPSFKNNMISRTQKWYKQLTNDPFKNIVYKSCSLPFLDIQEAGFEMLLKLSEQPWGQEEINKCPLIIDLVLEQQTTDGFMSVKTLKQKIIKTLLESDTSKDILDEGIMLRIQNYDDTRVTSTVGLSHSQSDVLVEDMAQ